MVRGTGMLACLQISLEIDSDFEKMSISEFVIMYATRNTDSAKTFLG